MDTECADCGMPYDSAQDAIDCDCDFRTLADSPDVKGS